MKFIPDSFSDISLGTHCQSACSPEPPSNEWSGVIITAPAEISFRQDTTPVVIPVCGYFLVPVLKAMDEPSVMTIHISSDKNREQLSAEIIEEGENEPDIPPPDDAPTVSRKDLKNTFTGGYFNINAQKYFQQYIKPGYYDIMISYTGFQSNHVKVHIKKETE